MKQSHFERRLAACYDELKWLYTELYGDTPCFQALLDSMRSFAEARRPALQALDLEREADPGWYRRSDMLGMMLYTEQFAGRLSGIEERIPYLKELRVRYLHLMPLLKMPEEENDGGYAVSDFRQVDGRIGTMEELSRLADVCRAEGMSICLDFIVNHTSDEHEWAVRAKKGEPAYQARYLCFDTYDIPAEYEKTVPQVFPNTAPGNFIFCKEMGKYVLSSFNPYQWDINYKNPAVFHEMAENLLYLANVGIEIFRIDAVPYLWKELGTSCRNLPQVHTVMRMLRMIAKAVCPAVVFKGEVVMAPREVAPYFGPVDKPECDILYNVTTMVCIWNSLATRDVTLLKWQMETMDALPPEFTFVNYVRCHDDIGWGLEERSVEYLGADPLEHKKFLYHFYTGEYPGSFARGELYNYDPVTQDARSCGTCASLCGVEAALEAGDEGLLETAIRRHLMIHAYIASLSGIPVIYSGDEIAQLNDWQYREDPVKALDSRFIHRGKLDWARAAGRHDRSSVQGRVFTGLQEIIRLRAENPVFSAGAREHMLETGDRAVLAFQREGGGQVLAAAYNFCEQPRRISLALEGDYRDLFTGQAYCGGALELAPYQALWLLRS